ncbi:uncharacterized protein LOC114660528 isoform X2 [Erpetoichthys calabaricus]|nr:uncharacterized protein LOC114660528 isoform X2 [Erpetoichthys calabaricus]
MESNALHGSHSKEGAACHHNEPEECDEQQFCTQLSGLMRNTTPTLSSVSQNGTETNFLPGDTQLSCSLTTQTSNQTRNPETEVGVLDTSLIQRYTSPALHASIPNMSCPLRTAGNSLWKPCVLQEFDKLQDFSPEEVQALQCIMGLDCTWQNVVRGVGVREFLVSYYNSPHLRQLCEEMKNLKRDDVVIALHYQKSILPQLGPKQKEELKIGEMKFTVWHVFTMALSVEHEQGLDWRWLAEKLDIPQFCTQLWRQKSKNPAEEVLNSWKNKISEATVGKLFDYMISMKREDLADLL